MYDSRPDVLWKPATITKWLRRKSAGESSPAMYCGELTLEDGTVWPLAEVDPKRDRRLSRRNEKWVAPNPDW
jgi:hypothetical protein